MLQRIITHDEADWEILKLANEKGKFAIQMGAIPEEDLQTAFERGIDNDWFTLVDVGPLAHALPDLVMRVFKLTAAGQARHDELQAVFD